MTNALLDKFEAMKRVYPHGNVEDLIEASVMSLEGTLPTITEAQIEREQQSLRRLEKALGLYEIASFLLDTAGPEAVGTALKRIEEQREQEPTIAWAMANPQKYQEKEEYMDNGELVNAIVEAVDNGDDDTLEDLLEKIRERRKIRLGVNRTKISDNRLGFNKHVRDFHSLVNKPINDFNRLARLHREGEQLTDEEFEALAENVMNEDDSNNLVNENVSFRIRQIMIQKAAEKRDAEKREKAGVEFGRNRLANEALPPAQASIAAHGTPSAQEVAKMMSTDDDAIRVAEVDTRKALPPEFSIQPTEDRSFAAAAKRTKAAATIARPSKIDFKDQENEEDLPRYWRREKAANTAANVPAASTYKSQPNQQGYTKMDPEDVDRYIADERSIIKKHLKGN